MIRDAKGHGSADKGKAQRKLAAELREAAQTPEFKSMDRALRSFRRLMRRRAK